LGSQFDLSESRDVIGYVTIRLAIRHFLLVVLLNQASISNSSGIFNGECDLNGRRDAMICGDAMQCNVDAMVDVTLNAPFSHNTYVTDDRRGQYCSVSATVNY